jgi:hypothetical protein
MKTSESEKELPGESSDLILGGSCFPLALFKNKEEMSDYICPINFGVLNNPVTDNCGHTFCNHCLNHFLKTSSKCPFTDNTIIKSEVMRADSLQASIQKSFVRCYHKSCEWKGILSELFSHLSNQCEFQIIECREENCKEKFLRRDCSTHNKICKFKSLSCEYCQSQMELQDYSVRTLS